MPWDSGSLTRSARNAGVTTFKSSGAARNPRRFPMSARKQIAATSARKIRRSIAPALKGIFEHPEGNAIFAGKNSGQQGASALTDAVQSAAVFIAGTAPTRSWPDEDRKSVV